MTQAGVFQMGVAWRRRHHEMFGHLVADIMKGEKDPSGSVIEHVYAKHPPHYAVYRTSDRVSIEYADDPIEEQRQRQAICELNPLRDKIACLTDGWRTSRHRSRQLAVKHVDRRIADALIMACEEDVVGAESTLIDVKNDLLCDRISWARFLYLAIASVTAVVGSVVVAAIVHHQHAIALSASHRVLPMSPLDMLLLAAGAGTVGAFFSIALSIRKRTILPDLYMLNNGADAALRIFIGIIAAAVLVSLLQTRLVTFGLGSDSISLDDGPKNLHAHPSWMLVLLVGFVGGFLERLVPDLLEKVAVAAGDVSVTTPGAAPKPEAGKTNVTNGTPGNGNSRNGRQNAC